MNNMQGFLLAEDVFSIWAPERGLWSNWVKPALFASVDGKANIVDGSPVELPNVDWYSSDMQRAALILDLPSDQSVWESIALLKYSYQPVPLFNCCREVGMVVDVGPIVDALWKGTSYIKAMDITKNTLPVFLLDRNRLSQKELIVPGKFDNRWCVVPQDMPSASMLKSKGISKVCLRTNYIDEDVAHILKRYQVEGLKVLVQDVSDNSIQEFSTPVGSLFRSIWYRFSVMSGLSRNAAGGFGAVVPMPSQGGG